MKGPRFKKQKTKAEYLMQLFVKHQKVKGMTRTILAERIGVQPTTISVKKSRGIERFTVKDIREWATALEIPAEEVADAIYRMLV